MNFLERLHLVFRVLIGDPACPPDLPERLQQPVGGGAEPPEDIRPCPVTTSDGQQQVFGGEVLVLKLFRDLLGPGQKIDQGPGTLDAVLPLYFRS